MKRPNNCKTCGGKMEDGGTMSNFGKAFATARKQGLKTFDWNGKKYTTEYKEEMDTRIAKQPTEAGYSPIPRKTTMNNAPVRIAPSTPNTPVRKQAAPIKPPMTAPAKKEAPIVPVSTSTLKYQASDGTGASIATITRPNTAPVSNNSTKRTFTATDDTQAVRTTKTRTATPSPPVKSPELESGVIVDKRINQAYLVKNGKVQRQMNVITGENTEGERLAKNLKEPELDPKKRTTPQGDYQMKPAWIYGNRGFTLDALFEKYPGILGAHTTYNPEYRNQFYGTDKANKSWGCSNFGDCDMKELVKQFPQGDTLRVIDSKRGRTLESMGIKKQVGGLIDPKLFRPKPMTEIDPNEVPAPYDEDQNLTTEELAGLQPTRNPNRIQEGINQGVIEAKRDDVHAGDTQRTVQQQYNDATAPANKKRLPATPLNWQRNLGIGMMGVRTLLSEISGRVARSRQNQYDYDQQAMLGLMNPMPTNDFQPNPYSLYAKYGGKLKHYQLGGNMLVPQIPKISGMLNQSTQGPTDDLVDYQTAIRRLAESQNISRAEAKKLYDSWQANVDGPSMIVPQQKTNFSYTYPNPSGNGQLTKYANSLEDWNKLMEGKSYISQQVAGDKSSASASGYGPQKYGGLLHAKYFGPKFNNNASYKFSDAEKFDKVVVSRSIVPDLILRKNWGNKRVYRGKKEQGGIHIKPENKGKFTEYCGGKVTGECIEKGLDSPSATIRKRANFARNARKWNK